MRLGRVDYFDKRRWRPATQVSPLEVAVPAGTTFLNHTFEAGQDGIIVPAATTRKRGIEAKEGRNVRLIGGEVNFAGGTTTTSGNRLMGFTGEIFVEGELINIALAEQDGLDLGGSANKPFTRRPDVTIQKCRIVGIDGDFEKFHGDGFQVQGAMNHLRISEVTVESNYQGMLIVAQKPVARGILDRVNFKYGPEPKGKQLFMVGQGSGEGPFGEPATNPYPLTLNEVYCDPGTSGKELWEMVFPDKGVMGEVGGEEVAIGAESDDGWASCFWPAVTGITGRVIRGAPPGGDFCKVSECGIGYVSPGYAGGA